MRHELVVEGRIANPDRIFEAQLGIDEGRISVMKRQGLRGERTLDARGCLIFPGFIDLHVHLREDSSHQWNYKEDFNTGTTAALHGGVTTVLDMPNTPLPGITADRIRAKKALARSQGLVDILFCGGVSNSNVTALGDLQPEVAAFKLFFTTMGELQLDDATVPDALKAVESTSRPATIHCEDPRIIEQRAAELNVAWRERARQPELYPRLRPEAAELAAVKSVLSAAAAVPRLHINIAHVSVHETVELIKQHPAVHCEVTPHHLFFTREDAAAKQALLKMNPPLRTEENRHRLIAALKAGEIDFLATDHAPHTREEKSQGFADAPAGVPHLDTYGNFAIWLMTQCELHPTQIARICASNPAQFLGLADRGRIDVGLRAHLTILDLQKRTRIHRDRLYTKCGWSPFEGYEFPGTVKHTIYNGRVMTDYDDILGH
ncbi:MAG TPA: hypothetical protein ENN68_03550 [Methanomicrobia archaeon]|nr:hypothetical protein [Methanomicrobia archaeon]